MKNLKEFYEKYKNKIHIIGILLIIILTAIFGSIFWSAISGGVLSVIKFFTYKQKEKEFFEKLKDYDTKIQNSEETINKLLETLNFNEEEISKIKTKLLETKYNPTFYTKEELLNWLKK